MSAAPDHADNRVHDGTQAAQSFGTPHNLSSRRDHILDNAHAFPGNIDSLGQLLRPIGLPLLADEDGRHVQGQRKRRRQGDTAQLEASDNLSVRRDKTRQVLDDPLQESWGRPRTDTYRSTVWTPGLSAAGTCLSDGQRARWRGQGCRDPAVLPCSDGMLQPCLCISASICRSRRPV